MYIGVVPDVVILTVNWLHYLNYDVIPCTSSTFHCSIQVIYLGLTVSSHGWCNGIPHAALVFI